MKRPEHPSALQKREEMKTYRELSLGRELKSMRRRQRVQAAGRQRILGDGSDRLSYVIVPASRYRELRQEVQRTVLLEAKKAGLDLPLEILLQQLAPRIEALIHARLTDEMDAATAHQAPLAALGRPLTRGEQVHFAASTEEGAAAKTSRPRRRLSTSALDRVLGKIQSRQTHNPHRYQQVWAQMIGLDAAMQTHLERIDPATQTAYFRCLNSVLSADLQRRPGLPEKLGRALGVPIRRLRGQF